MNIFHSADISALANKHPYLQRTCKYIAYDVQLIPLCAKIQGLVGIGYSDVIDLAHFTITANCPRIRHTIWKSLLRVMNNKIANNSIWLQGNPGLAISLASAALCQKHRCQLDALSEGRHQKTHMKLLQEEQQPRH